MLTLIVLTDGYQPMPHRTLELATEGDDFADGTAYRISDEVVGNPSARHIQPIAHAPAGHAWGWSGKFAYPADATPDREDFHRRALGFVALPLFDTPVSLA